MNQNSITNDKTAMLAKIETINQVDGFDPTPVSYTHLYPSVYEDVLKPSESRKLKVSSVAL